MKFSAKAVIAFSFLFLFQLQAQAQKLRAKDMVVTAHGWYGSDMERTRPNLKTYGYMTYEAGVGFQTNPNEGESI